MVRVDDRYSDAEQAARDLVATDGAHYVHAYDDPAVVAGQGTAGVEPDGCQTLHAAMASGGPVDVETASVASCALGATRAWS